MNGLCPWLAVISEWGFLHTLSHHSIGAQSLWHWLNPMSRGEGGKYGGYRHWAVDWEGDGPLSLAGYGCGWLWPGHVPMRRGKRHSFKCAASSLGIPSQGGKEVICLCTWQLENQRSVLSFNRMLIWGTVLAWLCIKMITPSFHKLTTEPANQMSCLDPLLALAFCHGLCFTWWLTFLLSISYGSDLIIITYVSFSYRKSHCNLDRGHGFHCPHMVL